jgi:uncharacterized protein
MPLYDYCCPRGTCSSRWRPTSTRARSSSSSNVFLPGHRIRLEVSSSNFPRFDRNTNTGGVIADESAAQATVAVNRVLHGPGYPSHLTLPVIGRSI